MKPKNNSDYCNNCNCPLLYPNKPCPNCSTNYDEIENHPYKKPIIIALMLLGISCGLNIVVSIFAVIAGMQVGTYNGELFSAFLVGSIYANKFKEVMSKELRKSAAVYFCVIGTLLAIPAMCLVTKGKILLWILVIPFLAAIEALIVYWLMGWSGNLTLKIFNNVERD